MNMTQPAMTRIVRRLEDHLGVRLFERHATGIGLTIFGEAFLPYASLVLAEIGNARSLLESLSGASKGVIRVGGVGAANSGHLAAALFSLLKRQPALQVQVIEEIEDKLLLALKKGEIDLAVSPETYLDDEITLACNETLHDVVEVYAAPSHPLAGQRGLTMADAARHSWALPPPDTPVTREWRRRFFAAGIDDVETAISSRSVNMLKSMTSLGGFMCWMPRELVALEVEQGKLVALDLADLRWGRTFHIYRRRMGQLPPAVHLLLKELQVRSGTEVT
ncbi:MAG: LysR family transcriptional regulator, partial [Pararhodobacter sp.]